MRKFAHIALSVSNMEKTIGFYNSLLNLEISERFDLSDKNLEIVLLSDGEITLELFCFKNFNQLPEYRKDLTNDLQTIGTKHFALWSENINNDFAHVKKLDIEPISEVKTFANGAKYFFVKDPDGNFVEFIEKLD